jgi:hypothetical protein
MKLPAKPKTVKQEPKKEIFPLKGTFEGTPYFIDGDSVILTTSAGTQMQVGPTHLYSINEIEESIYTAIKSKLAHDLLYDFYTPTLSNLSQKKGTQVGGWDGDTSSKKLWNIDQKEENSLLKKGKEIMLQYFISKGKK